MEKRSDEPASKKERVQCLGMLMDLANVPDWPIPFSQAELVSAMDRRDQRSDWIKHLRRRYHDVLGYCSKDEIITICRLLRRVWTERSLPGKESFVFELRQFHAGIIQHTSPTTVESEVLVSQHQSALDALDAIFRRPSQEDITRGVLDFLRQQAVIDTYRFEPPRRTHFDKCLGFLLRRLRLLRICKRKDCATQRYFIADKPKQRYCSDTCARKARLATKRIWWKEHRSPKGGD